MSNKGTVWTEERTNELKTRHAAGESFTQIADGMNLLSRNSVGGKLWRLGLCRENQTRRRPRDQRATTHLKNAVTQVRRKRGMKDQPTTAHGQWSSDLKFLTAPQPLSGEVHVAPRMQCVGIADLEDGMCRWPTWPDNRAPGDAEAIKYCGEKAERGLPYCAHHCAIAFVRTTKVNTWLCPQQ